MDDGRQDERTRLVERAFGPEATREDRQALARFDGVEAERSAAAERAAAASPTAEAGQTAEAEADPAAAAPTEQPPGAGPGARRPKRRRLVLVAGAAAFLLAGFGVGLSLGQHRTAADAQAARVTAAERNLRAVQTQLPKADFSDWYDTPQSNLDVPKIDIPGTLVKTSFRSVGITDDSAGVRYYLAKDTSNYDCLVVVHGNSLSSACVSEQYFPASGLTVDWTTDGQPGSITWLPDGSFTPGVGG